VRELELCTPGVFHDLTQNYFTAFLNLRDLLGHAAPLNSTAQNLITSSDGLFLPHVMSLLRTPLVRVLARRVVPSFRDFCKLFWGAPVSVAERGVKLMYLLHRLKLPPWHPEHFSLAASLYTGPRRRLPQAAAAGAGAAAGRQVDHRQESPLTATSLGALSAEGLVPAVLTQSVDGSGTDNRGAGGQYKAEADRLQLGAWLTYALAFCILRQRGSSHMPSPPADGRPPPAAVQPLLLAWQVPMEEGAAPPPASDSAIAAAGPLGAFGGFVTVAERLHRSAQDAQASASVARDLSSSALGRLFCLEDPCSAFSRAGEQPLITRGGARVVAAGAALEFTFAPEATRAFNFSGMEGCQSHVTITATNRQLSTATRTVRVGKLQPGGGAVRPHRPLRAALMEAHSAVGAQEWTLQEARDWVADTALRLMAAASSTGGYWPDSATHSLCTAAPVVTAAAINEGTRRFATQDTAMGGLLGQLEGSLHTAVCSTFPHPPTLLELEHSMRVQGGVPCKGPLLEALRGAVQETGRPAQEAAGSMGPWAAAVAGMGAVAQQRAQQHSLAATWARCSEVGEGGARVLGKMFKSDPGAYISGGGFEGSGASSIGSLTLATAHEYSSVPSGSRGARITGIVGANELNWITARFCVDELFRVAVATDRIEVAARRLADEVQEVLAVRRAQQTGRLPLGVQERPSASLSPPTHAHHVVAAGGAAAVGYGGFFSKAFDDFPAFQGAVKQRAAAEAPPSNTLYMPQQREAQYNSAAHSLPEFLMHGYCAPNSCGAPEVPYDPPLRGAYGAVAQGPAVPPPPPGAGVDRGGPSSASPFLSHSAAQGALAASACASPQHDDDLVADSSDGEDDGEVVGSSAQEHSKPEQASADDDSDGDVKLAQAASHTRKRSQSPAPRRASGGGGGGGMQPWGGLIRSSDDGYSTLPMHAWWAALWRSDAELGWLWVPAYYAWHAMAERPTVQAIGGAAAPLADKRHWDTLQELAGLVPPVYATGATNGLWWLI